MANPQADRFVKISNELWDEVIRRDFSKRQKDIIMFVWRLSYGFQSKAARIPKMKDFELCGVPATQVKRELEVLEESHVLIWDREEMIFQINKDYEKWFVSLVKSWKKDRFKELLSLNIEHSKTSQNMKFDFMNHEDSEDENFTFHEEDTSQNMKKNFTFHEVEDGSIPCGSKAEEGSKDKKDIIKDIKDIKAAAAFGPNLDQTILTEDPFIEVLDTFCEIHGKIDTQVNGIDRNLMHRMITEGIPAPLITKVMRQVYEARTSNGARIHSFSYYEPAINEEWANEQAHDTRVTQQRRDSAAGTARQPVSQITGPAIPSADETRAFLENQRRLVLMKQETLRKRAEEQSANGTGIPTAL